MFQKRKTSRRRLARSSGAFRPRLGPKTPIELSASTNGLPESGGLASSGPFRARPMNLSPADRRSHFYGWFISKVVIYQHQWKSNWSYKCSIFKMCQNRCCCFIAYSNFLLLGLSLHGSWLAVRLLRNMPGQPVVTEVVNVGSKGGSSVVSVFM